MIVGLMGGICTGKSKVSSFLKSRGAFIIDADKIARRIVEPYTAVWQEIVNSWGKDILQTDLNLNRSKLSSIVFSDQRELKKLNNITHPEIKKEVKKEISGLNSEISLIIIDAALLIEIGLHDIVEQIWLLNAGRDIQIKRLIERDNISEAEAEKRIDVQMSPEEKRKYADLIIDNNGSWQETEKFLNSILENINLGREK